MKRVFIALSISQKTQAKVLEVKENFPSLPVRWLDLKNLHITLLPPWNEKEIEVLKEKFVSLSLPFPRLQPLRFHTVSFGPNSFQPRLIWAKGTNSSELLSLKTFLEIALEQKAERRDFMLHLTLARFRPESFLSFPFRKLYEKIDWEEIVPSLVLFESRLTPKGANYLKLAELSFK